MGQKVDAAETEPVIFSCRFIVEGRVQGVGFRYFTLRTARQMGVLGWVRNRADGSVEVRAEGDPAVVHRFLDMVRQGPSFSRVTGARMEEMEPERFSDFRIEV